MNLKPNTKGLKPPIAGEPSRNPLGRPKYKFIKDIFNVLLNEEVNLTDSSTGQKMNLNRAELMAMSQVKKAVNGDTRAFQAVIDRIEGKPIERISVTTTYEDQLMALSDEEKSDVYRDLKILQREHGIEDTVEIEVFEELENKYTILLQRHEDLLKRYEALNVID